MLTLKLLEQLIDELEDELVTFREFQHKGNKKNQKHQQKHYEELKREILNVLDEIKIYDERFYIIKSKYFKSMYGLKHDK